MKTIGIPEELHKELISLKLQEGNKNAAELIKKLIVVYKQQRFLEQSQKFNEILKKKKISFNQFLKESRKVREEIANEWYP